MAKGKLEVSGGSRCGRERVITDVSNDRSVSIFRVKQSEKLEHVSPSVRYISGINSNKPLIGTSHCDNIQTALR